MKGKIIVIFIFVLVTVSVLSFNETTYALYNSSDNVTNNFNAGDISIRIDEKKDTDYEVDFNDICNWDGKEQNKIVRIQNLSSSDAFIRVFVGLRWVDENGSPFAGDTSFVKVNLSDNDMWFKDDISGYYYYKQIINKDEYTKPVIDSINSSIANLNIVERKKYQGKKLIVDVKAEAVQANGDMYKTVWKDIGEDAAKMLEAINH